jgi:hypothetical protein
MVVYVQRVRHHRWQAWVRRYIRWIENQRRSVSGEPRIAAKREVGAVDSSPVLRNPRIELPVSRRDVIVASQAVGLGIDTKAS